MLLVGDMLRVEIDDDLGVIASVRAVSSRDEEPEYVGSHGWSADPSSPVPQRLGDVLIRTWQRDGWRTERTAASADIRHIDRLGAGIGVRVTYAGRSQGASGLCSVGLREEYRLADDGSFHWTIAISNTTDADLEIGELSIPLMTNTDASEIFERASRSGESSGALQKKWHEQRVLQHLFVSGHASYALLQRPSGETPALLIHPTGDTSLEVAYQVDPAHIGQWGLDFEGPYYLSICSRAARFEGRWLWNRERQAPWFNGHSSIGLKPGEERRFGFRFAVVRSRQEVANELVSAGQVAVDIEPGPVIPVGRRAGLSLRSSVKAEVVPEDDGMDIVEIPGDDGVWLYWLTFASPGQKRLLVRYGERWTRLLFFATEPPGALLAARARTISERQFYRNASDSFGRDHAFLPYDDHVSSLYLDGEETWQAGASDEYGLPISMFLAAKNAVRPSKSEIAVLEQFIDDFLLRRLQNPDTLRIRSGMYWLEQWPSSRSHEWGKERSERTDRSFNYALVASIYHSMYRISRRYRLTARPAGEYLRLAWQTAVLGFDVGSQRDLGAPAGIQLFELLEDLHRDDPVGYKELHERLRRFSEQASVVEYPFGSELYTDQTGQPQVFAAMDLFGFDAQRRRALRVILALRSGAQPVWFSYGNDKRGNVCCWYGTGYNSIALLSAFTQSGNRDLLSLGYGGLASLLCLVRSDGTARGWFTWWPDRTGFDSRSLDSDMALHSYVLGAQSIVVSDETFGWIGYGCDVSEDREGALRIRPDDGIRKRVLIPALEIELTADTGDIAAVLVSPDRRSLTATLEDPTGLVSLGRLTVRSGSRTFSLTVVAGDGIQTATTGSRSSTDFEVPFPS